MKTISVNGINVKVTEKEYKAYQKEQKELLLEAKRKMIEAERKELEQDDKLLNSRILDILKTDMPIIKRKALSQLLTQVNCREDYEYKEWLFNDGKLRSDFEVEQYKIKKEQEYYRKSSDYNTSSTLTNLLCFVVPFLLGFCFIMSKDGAVEASIVTLPIALFVALLFSLIGMTIGYSINVSRGKRKGLDESDSRLCNEKSKRNAAIIGGVITGVSLTRKSKNALKDISNPDSWSEMK